VSHYGFFEKVLCNCGKEGRYFHILEDNSQVLSCNKRVICAPYDVLKDRLAEKDAEIAELKMRLEAKEMDSTCDVLNMCILKQDDEIDRLKAINTELVEALEALSDSYHEASGYWWCPNCGITMATFQELCDKCGYDLNTEVEGLISHIDSLLAKAKGEA